MQCPPKTLSFLYYSDATKNVIHHFTYFTEKYSLASLANFIIASNITADSYSRSITANNHRSNCNIYKGGTSCATTEGINTTTSPTPPPRVNHSHILKSMD